MPPTEDATSRDLTQTAGPPGSRLPLGKTAGFSFVPGEGIISDLKGRRCVLAPRSRRLTHSHRIPRSGMRIVWHGSKQSKQSACQSEEFDAWARMPREVES
jgi:hypothetical protein